MRVDDGIEVTATVEDLTLKGRDLEEWEAACEGVRHRTLEQHLDAALGYRTHRPVYDDHDGPGAARSFETMAEYRRWCAAEVPAWLGFGPAPEEWGVPEEARNRREKAERRKKLRGGGRRPG